MKKGIKIIIIVLVSLIIGIFVDKMFFTNKRENLSTEKSIQKKNTETLSMMLETGAGTGVYESTTGSTWPTDGYLFNKELSKCENGGNLSWNDENNTVVMTGSTSDKCYVYFDVYTLAVINSLTEETTTSSIKLIVNATTGTKPITKYYYSKDNGTSYIESISNTYTFSELTSGTTYNMKVYAVDEKGKSSAVYSKSVKINVTLADYVKNQYTGTQGANGLYLHNSSLANGAGDNSYRYAGANPNNYVCFGSDADSCPDDNLYRIIGVFGNQVKLIKSSLATSAMLGTNGSYRNNTEYHWNNSTNTNIWSASNLNTVNLNTNYITYLNNQNTKWTRKIAETTWKVGGNTSSNIPYVTPQNAYQNEIVSPAANTTYNAKIGLMYVSDFGYAASPSAWTTKLRFYNNVASENWMYGSAEWTITRISDSSYYAFCVISAGHMNFDSVYDSSSQYYDNYGVRPCFYLNSNVTYSSGTGEKNSPIRLS